MITAACARPAGGVAPLRFARMIDLHCHLLPGLDDGPKTIEESMALARAAVAAGTTTIVATPHVSEQYPNDSDSIATALATVRERLEAEGIPLQVKAGAEIAMTVAVELDPDELRRLRIGDGPWLLIETPYSPAVDAFPLLINRIREAGHQVILAHPERCHGLRRAPEVLYLLRDRGVLSSVTAGSLTGRFGRHVQRFAVAMADEGLIHNVASDAHDCKRRPPDLGPLIELAGLTEHRALLCETSPQAIIDGTELPPFPLALLGKTAPRGARGLWQRLRPEA